MTHTLEVPQAHWAAVLDIINKGAHGRPVRLEVETMASGDQELGDRMPLREIEFEPKGSEAPALLISCGDDAENMTHVVDEPDVMSIGYGADAQLEWLAVSGTDGSKTILYFEDFDALPSQAEEGVSGPA